MSFSDTFTPYKFPKFGYVRLPEIVITNEEKQLVGAADDCPNFEFLRALALKGFKEKKNRLTAKVIKDYTDRAKRELDLFKKLGFVDYILLVWKVTSYCDKNNIARDYGRGSAAGSLIFYLIGVTNVEPLKYDLFFERFVSETRAKQKDFDGVNYVDGGLAPDVDIDIEQTKRAEVIEYLKTQYPERVCKILTLSTLSGKSLIKECGKILGEKKEEEMKVVADLIPKRFGIVKDIQEAYKDEAKFRQWCDNNRRAYETALKLRDLIKNKGSHPSGYVVAYDSLKQFLPLELVRKKDSKEKEISVSFSMEYISKLTIKLDLLGVRCCSVVSEVLKAVKENIEDINIDSDPIIYDNLQNLKTPHGIFQIEAPTNLQVCQKIRPKNLGELSDVVAIARPGALSFLEAYDNNQQEKIHDLFDSILASSRGVCLYQEQMMQLAHAIGFTLDEAEQLRRIVGKKKIEQMVEWEKKVIDKIKANNLPEHLGSLLWKILNDSANYSFNKSHSISYAALAALTTYLKFKYPLQFFLSLLSQSKHEPKPLEEISKAQAELRTFSINLLPPHLLKSGMDFTLEGRNIRFGLSSIKGISEKTIQKLGAFKNDYANKFQVFEGANNAGLSISVQSALIQSGCLDGLSTNPSRARLTLEAQLWNLLSVKERRYAMDFGKQFNYELFAIVRHLRKTNDAKGKPIIKESRAETITKHYKDYLAIFNMNDKEKTLANFFYERMLLGYSYSVSLIEAFGRQNNNLLTVEDVQNSEDGDYVEFVGVLKDKTFEGTSNTEKKTRYARFTVGDETGSITALMFNTADEDRIRKVKEEADGKLPTKNGIVYCVGQRKGDAVFLKSIKPQNHRIYTRYKDLGIKPEEPAEQEVEAVEPA